MSNPRRWADSGITPGPGQRSAGGLASGCAVLGLTRTIVAFVLAFGVGLLLLRSECGTPGCGVVAFIAVPILVPLFLVLVLAVSGWVSIVVSLIRLWRER